MMEWICLFSDEAWIISRSAEFTMEGWSILRRVKRCFYARLHTLGWRFWDCMALHSCSLHRGSYTGYCGGKFHIVHSFFKKWLCWLNFWWGISKDVWVLKMWSDFCVGILWEAVWSTRNGWREDAYGCTWWEARNQYIHEPLYPIHRLMELKHPSRPISCYHRFAFFFELCIFVYLVWEVHNLDCRQMDWQWGGISLICKVEFLMETF